MCKAHKDLLRFTEPAAELRSIHDLRWIGSKRDLGCVDLLQDPGEVSGMYTGGRCEEYLQVRDDVSFCPGKSRRAQIAARGPNSRGKLRVASWARLQSKSVARICGKEGARSRMVRRRAKAGRACKNI